MKHCPTCGHGIASKTEDVEKQVFEWISSRAKSVERQSENVVFEQRVVSNVNGVGEAVSRGTGPDFWRHLRKKYPAVYAAESAAAEALLLMMEKKLEACVAARAALVVEES